MITKTLKIFFTLIFLSALVLISCNNGRDVPAEEIVVRVGSEVLTFDQLASEIPSDIRKKISKEQVQDYVLRWINSEVLYQEARRRGLTSAVKVERELEKIKRELIVNELLDREISRRDWVVTQAQIRQFYDANKESFRRDEQEVHVFHIYVEDKKTADSLYQQLRRRGDFAAVARKIAADAGEDTPWDLHFFESEVPEAARKIFRLKPGATAAPIELDDGYHIFKVVEKFRKGTFRDMEIVRDEIESKIKSQMREERYRELLSELRSNTRIETNFQMLETMPIDSIFVGLSTPSGI